MKKIYIVPEMEILDAEIEGILSGSALTDKDNGYKDFTLGRSSGGDFDDFDDFEEDDY